VPFRNANFHRLTAGLLAMVALLAGLWLWQGRATVSPKAKIAMMSSISLQWGEVSLEDLAQGEAQPSIFYQKIAENNTVAMVDTLSQLEQLRPDLLILVQPRLLNPEELVALDKWVRSGGRVLIFADPALQWPSRYPLGDSKRPLFTSFLSPLFAHWGLELVLPVTNDEEQVVTLTVADQELSVISHGNWIYSKSAKSGVPCRIEPTALIATCKPGKGRVVLIADADILQDENLGTGLLSSSQLDWLLKLVRSQAEKTALPSGL
jgi:hypothetical protein